MKGIAIVGSKGGSGKTSLSHALALGASWHNTDAILCHTDNKDPLVIKKRPYLYVDTRDPKKLNQMIDFAHSREGLFIVDGGGNRTEVDTWIAPLMDLLLIPITPDQDSVKQAIRDYSLIKDAGGSNIHYLINRFPANRFEHNFIKKLLSDIIDDDILCIIPDVKSIRILVKDDDKDFYTPATKLNNLARGFFKKVMRNLG